MMTDDEPTTNQAWTWRRRFICFAIMLVTMEVVMETQMTSPYKPSDPVVNKTNHDRFNSSIRPIHVASRMQAWMKSKSNSNSLQQENKTTSSASENTQVALLVNDTTENSSKGSIGPKQVASPKKVLLTLESSPTNQTNKNTTTRSTFEYTQVTPINDTTPSTENGVNSSVGPRQVYAAQVLQRMQERGAMNGNISSRDHVLHNGFPRMWDSCTLEFLLQKKKLRAKQEHGSEGDDDALNFVLLGGSSSSRPGDNCIATTENGDMPGRYSDLLEERLFLDAKSYTGTNQSIPKFRVFNRAQGSQESTNNALLLDGLLDANATDVIIWEFAMNDMALTEQKRKLDFWLTRVKAFFAQAGRLPPPILLVYLWETSARTNVERNQLTASIDMNPTKYTGDLIDTHRSMGWDIAVINVGGSVNKSAVASNVKWMFDDHHHPSCEAVKLTADMLQHVIYSNLATSCTIDTALESSINAHEQRNQTILKHHQSIPPGLPTECEQLWTDLFQESTVVGSISAFKPRLGNVTKLRAEKLDHIWSWPTMLKGEIGPGRQDRKWVPILPACDGAQNFTNTLLEPELKWVGISLQGNRRERESFSFTINNEPIKLTAENAAYDKCMYMNHWILIRDQIKKADNYTLSFCSLSKHQKPYFYHLLGVSVPAEVLIE